MKTRKRGQAALWKNSVTQDQDNGQLYVGLRPTCPVSPAEEKGVCPLFLVALGIVAAMTLQKKQITLRCNSLT